MTLYAGIRHLLEASAVQPALLVARSQFEVFLSIRYLVHGGEEDISRDSPTNTEERGARARSYYAAGLRTAIYRRKAVLDGAEGASPIDDEVEWQRLQEEVESEVARLEECFADEHDALGPLACFPSEGKKPRYYDRLTWYSPGFPNRVVRSIKALADELGCLGQYFLLYSPLSDLGHARDIEHDVEIEDGKAAIKSPYDPTAFAAAAYWSAAWQGFAINLACRAYSPESLEDHLRIHERGTELLKVVGDEVGEIFLG